MNGQVYSNIPRFRKTALMTGILFFLSLFSPLLQVFAFESNFYDGPGGYAIQSRVQHDVNRTIDFHQNLNDEATFRTHKVVGMGVGAAVGGGLIAALGLAASPILAAAAIVGSIVAGGFIGSQVGQPAGYKPNSSINFLSWAGGLAGGLLGFMIPGGSIIGATIGTAAGGMLGNALADRNRINSARRMLGAMGPRGMMQPPGLIEGAMGRMSGGFMGPIGSMAENPMIRSRLIGGSLGPEWAGAPGWFNQNGQFNPGMPPGMNPLMNPNLANALPMDFRTQYVWHDNNGELAYPGWEEDLYRVDGSASLTRTMPEWTTGRGGSYGGIRGGYEGRSGVGYGRRDRSGVGYGPNSGYDDEGDSSGSSIENPDWDGSSRFGRRSRISYDDGDVYSTHTTSDGETFNPSFEIGSDESLVSLSARYQDAVEELRNLTTQNAPAVQRRRAHQEVQRLERLLHQALR